MKELAELVSKLGQRIRRPCHHSSQSRKLKSTLEYCPTYNGGERDVFFLSKQ